MKTNRSLDMTQGPLLGNILLFSLPLMATNILQLLFNATDMAVVGRFAGHTSLAAVGSSVSAIAMVVNFIVGLSVGISVVIARYLGMGGHERQISRVLHTAISIALIFGTMLGLVGIACSNWMMDFMSMPDDVRPLALLYVRIYLLGTPFAALYNYGAAALRAKGDTRRPLFFLVLSGLLNLGLNLIFVIVFKWDVVGVAIATITSQLFSAGLILRSLARSTDELHFSWKCLCIDMDCLRDMARIGIPSGIQACVYSFANLMIQGSINSYGSIVMAGCSAAMNIENLLYLSMNAFHQTCQTFVSQNIGAGRQERVGQVVRTCLLSTVVLGVIQSTFIVTFSHEVLSIYNQDPAVIQAGVERVIVVSSLYTLWGLSDVLMGAMLGYGNAMAPMLINLFGAFVLRLVWVLMLDTSTTDIFWLHLSFPVTWVIILTTLTIYWRRLQRKNTAPTALPV